MKLRSIQLFTMFLLLIACNQILGQHKPASKILKEQFEQNNNASKEIVLLSNDTNINLLFYNIDIYVAIDSQYIEGTVHAKIEIINNNVSTIFLDLDSAYTVNEIAGNCLSYEFENKLITINLDGIYNAEDIIELEISYSGEPRLIQNLKSVRYETHANGEPIIATLSTPFLAHMWWPCKDGTTDKPDSIYIDITIKDTTVNSIPLIAVSNGLLDEVVANNGMKTFKWKHRYPIVPYYVMFAISNYQVIEDEYSSPSGYQMPLDYYVFEEHYATAQQGVANLSSAIECFENLFGTYPFKDEKYGMTQLGFYGGIENQTNTIIGSMAPSWEMVFIHELAHMWFADMITCANWHHCWVNEGFASYAEALYIEYYEGYDAYKDYMEFYEYYNSGTIYLQDDTNPMQVFVSIAYEKGAYVLHMLRHVLGDEDFFTCISNYANDPTFKYGNATTEDFQAVCESISKADLGYFFEQWIYDERYPKYYYSYFQDQFTNELTVNLEQKQNEMNGWREVFTMPVDIKIHFTDNTDTLVKVFNELQSQDYDFQLDKVVSSIEIDPEDWILCQKYFIPDLVDNQDLMKGVQVWPNPTNGIIHIENNSNIEIEKIELYSISGEKVFELNYTETIDVSKVSAGCYYIRIHSKENLYTKKIVIN